MTDHVFVAINTGKPLSPNGIVSVLRRLKARAGVTGRVNPHSFRHYFAKATLRQGASLKAVSSLMNHSGVAITADVYGSWERQELGNIHDRISPLRGLINF